MATNTQTRKTPFFAAMPFSLRLNQERMVIAISVVLFILFSIALDGFLQVSNLLALLQGVAVLGILAIGMALVVIGRGIDLTMVAVMVFSVGWSFALASSGMPLGLALLLGFLFAILVGMANGLLIAYVEIPAIFATLAVATIVAGIGRFALVDRDNVYVSGDIGWLLTLGTGRVLEIPVPVIVFAVLACAAYVGLRYTKQGHFIYAMGDNPQAARNAGIAIRPITVLLYSLSSAVAFAAGIVMATTVSSVNTKLAGSTMVYDIILVVVIGGIGLSGGKGSVLNVIAGTVLIGLLLNGMTIMDVSYPVQNIIKSLILLLAIIFDSVLNPRDEQTSQQGDI
ncbi:ABC transporter permease [Aquibium sp. LZ166]|uniref:ABC transporter permease n=1 Tax=Aquibium pacificus TaxID=3153579 RepID=A0ABV3SES8_9HYPH